MCVVKVKVLKKYKYIEWHRCNSGILWVKCTLIVTERLFFLSSLKTNVACQCYKAVRAFWSRVEIRTNSCYFTCSIHYLNASSASISRYHKISDRRFLLSYNYHARSLQILFKCVNSSQFRFMEFFNNYMKVIEDNIILSKR